MARGREKKRHRWLIVLIIVLLVLGTAAGALGYMAVNMFRIRSITFEGTDKYTDEELTDYIFSGLGAVNSLKLAYDLKHSEKVSIPFIETYEVQVEYPDKVHVVLYEKSVVAYVIYKENYMYLDKDGIIVESSGKLLLDVPMVDGLEFGSIVLYCPLPVEDETVFDTILDLSQNLQKYGIAVDKIHFNEDLSIVLHMGDVKVNLGTGDRLNEKLHELKQIVPELSGLSGTLHMENFKEGNDFITFKKDEK